MTSSGASSRKTTVICIILLFLVFAVSFLAVALIKKLVLKELFPDPDTSHLKRT